MYTWVKVVLALIIISFLSLILFIFRDYIPDDLFGNDKDVPGTSTTVQADVKPAKTPAVEDVKPVVPEDSVVPALAVKVEDKVETPALIEDADYNKALKLFTEEKFVEARDLLWKVMTDRKLDENNQLFWQFAELLDKVNTLVITTDLYVPEKIRHNIVSGDSLSKLAKRYKTTVESIQKTNNMKPDQKTLFAGQTLFIYPGFWTIKVIKSQYRLILFDQGRVFKVYNIATGRQNRTPVGKFTIKTKQKDPAWTAPGKNIPAGDPENVLGTRWMGIEENKAMSQHIGYGIHGTTDPNSIGSSASNGCVRMRNEEVEELYDIVPYGTQVEIVE